MNFGAHICVAARSAHPGRSDLIGLGAALPDLAAIGRFRLRRPCENADVAAGVAVHYTTDDLFHGHDLFTGWQRCVAGALEPSTLSRGARRAVAHVGPELMIDSVLLGREANREVIRVALASITTVANALRPMVNDPDRDAWAVHLDDVASWPTPETLGDSARIAQRMHRILSRRPRLAFAESAIEAVAVALDTVSYSISDEAEALVTDLATRTQLVPGTV